MREADVVVVGAGPAGTAAAITLARGGRDVVVIDRARFPRDKCCGDGLTTAALRLLEELGLDPADVGSWTPVADAWVRSPSGHTVCFPLPADGGIFAAVARRADLDAALVALARSAGATVLEGHSLLAADTSDARRIVVDIESEVDGTDSIAARYAIGADGMWSPLRRMLGASEAGYLGEWHAFRQYFTGVAPGAAERLWIWFEPDLLPGYAWSFPLAGGRANVGFGIQRDSGIAIGDMKHIWPDLLARPHIRQVLGEAAMAEGPHRAWPIPARVDRATLVVGRALFVGDAAGTTDPLTGEGIAQALLSGMLAAQAVNEAGPNEAERAAEAYQEAIGHALVGDHHMSAFLSGLLRHRTGARLAVRASGASDWTRRNFARWLFEDYPRALATTPRRWHPGAMSGPGAYRRNDSAAAGVFTGRSHR